MLMDDLNRVAPPGARRGERGVSIIELLVGVAVGLFIVGGATSLFVANLVNSRKMLLEARLNQDLRAASDLITRDLRRAGYWGNPMEGVMGNGAASLTVANPYSTIAATPSATNGQVTYAYAKDTNDVLDNNENFGFRRSATTGAIEMQTTLGTWQQLTDPTTLNVTALNLTAYETPVPVGDACATPFRNTATSVVELCCDKSLHDLGLCATGQAINYGPAGGGTPQCPTVTVRSYDLVLTGNAVRYPAVQRTLRTQVRVRNDLVNGTCP